MSYSRQIIEKLVEIQDKFYGEAKPIIDSEGVKERCSILSVIGPEGETMKLKLKDGKLSFADSNDIPVHHFKVTEDAFLKIVAGELEPSEAFDKKKATILDYEDGGINIVEIIKWKQAFGKMRHVMDKFIKNYGGR